MLIILPVTLKQQEKDMNNKKEQIRVRQMKEITLEGIDN